MGGRGNGGRETVTPRGASDPAVNICVEGPIGTWAEEREGGPLLFWYGVEVSGEGSSKMNGANGASSGDKLD